MAIQVRKGNLIDLPGSAVDGQPLFTEDTHELYFGLGASVVPLQIDAVNIIGLPPAGTVTQVNTGTGLSGGPITASGTVALADTAVVAGPYTNTNLTVDAQGRITAASNGTSGGGIISPDTPPASPTIYDDEFNEGSLSSQWTPFNTSSNYTATLRGGLISMEVTAASGDNLRGMLEALPAAPYTFQAKSTLQIYPVLGQLVTAGLVIGDSSGKLVSFGLAQRSTPSVGSNGLELDCIYWNNYSSYNSTPTGGTPNAATFDLVQGYPVYLQVQDDNTNLTFSVSRDGVGWYQLFQYGRTAFLSSPSTIGLMGAASNNSGAYVLFAGYDWIRRTA